MPVFNAYDVRVHMAWIIPPLLPDLQQLPRIGLLDTSGEIGFAQLIIISYKTTEVEVKLLHSIHSLGAQSVEGCYCTQTWVVFAHIRRKEASFSLSDDPDLEASRRQSLVEQRSVKLAPAFFH
jgi:hypothetical protein